MEDNVLTSLLSVAKEIVDDLLPPFADELFGVESDVFFPIESRSIYGSNDSRYTYSGTPDISNRKFIYVGLFTIDRFVSDGTADPYGTEAYMITERNTTIPMASKVIARLTTEKFFTFRVDQVKGFPGNNNYIYKRYNLIPIEGNVR